MSVMGGFGMLATAVALPLMGARIDQLGPGAALQMMALAPAALGRHLHRPVDLLSLARRL